MQEPPGAQPEAEIRRECDRDMERRSAARTRGTDRSARRRTRARVPSENERRCGKRGQQMRCGRPTGSNCAQSLPGHDVLNEAQHTRRTSGRRGRERLIPARRRYRPTPPRCRSRRLRWRNRSGRSGPVPELRSPWRRGRFRPRRCRCRRERRTIVAASEAVEEKREHGTATSSASTR